MWMRERRCLESRSPFPQRMCLRGNRFLQGQKDGNCVVCVCSGMQSTCVDSTFWLFHAIPTLSRLAHVACRLVSGGV